jgi:hypothetical protein
MQTISLLFRFRAIFVDLFSWALVANIIIIIIIIQGLGQRPVPVQNLTSELMNLPTEGISTLT